MQKVIYVIYFGDIFVPWGTDLQTVFKIPLKKETKTRYYVYGSHKAIGYTTYVDKRNAFREKRDADMEAKKQMVSKIENLREKISVYEQAIEKLGEPTDEEMILG